MKAVVTLLLLVIPTPAQGERSFAEGVRLLRAGRAPEALRLLRDAEQSHGDDGVPADLLGDLAVAAWRAGERDAAEGYAERAAARDPGRERLRDLIVGSARMVEAAATREAPDVAGLEAGIAKVGRAISAFEHALAERRDEATRVLLEQALRLRDELERLRDEKQRQQDEQKQQDEKDKPGQPKPDEQKQVEPGSDRTDPDGDPDTPGADRSDPDPKPVLEPEPDSEPAQEPAQEPAPTPEPERKQGEDQPRLLTPAEKQRLMDMLDRFRRLMLEHRKQKLPQHVPGKKDW
ncbi:MAG: hypothetical protein R3F30_10230 [Planctomycetota bacterium]